MKLKVLALVLFASGLVASYALAAPGKGHGRGHDAAAAASTTAATTTQQQRKVTLCHRAGRSGRWVRVTVSVHAAKAHARHGDVAPDASGHCPAPTAATGQTTTGETTTATTTDETTTDETTTDETTTDETTTDETTTTEGD